MKKNKRLELVHKFIKMLAIQGVHYTTKIGIGLIAAIYGKGNKYCGVDKMNINQNKIERIRNLARGI